jgi:phosphate acyltransferase
VTTTAARPSVRVTQNPAIQPGTGVELHKVSQPGVYVTGQGRTRHPVIAVDAMGGDHAPGAIVAGAVEAFRTWGTRIVLIGKPGQVRPLLAQHGVLGEIRLVTAEDSVAMNEGALASWRRPRSSIAVACQLVHLGQATAVMSAGSTGAIVALARLRLRNLPGVIRPALAVALPTQPTPTVLIDAGATADPKPEMLAQFAQLGSAYAEVAFGITRPRVGLLTIGAEPSKGNKLARKTHEMLSGEPTHGAMPINFAGNVEGCDLLASKVDVVVTEGFAGNIALKTLEGTAAFTASQFRSALGNSRSARLGAMLARKDLREVQRKFDPEAYGGAALLGLEGAVIIAHGAASARGAAAACQLAATMTSRQIAERIKERLGPQRQGHFLRRTDRH